MLGIACVLSYYKPTAQNFSVFGKPMFDALDYLTSNIMMPIGAIIFSAFVGWVLKKDGLFFLFGDFMGKFWFEIGILRCDF